MRKISLLLALIAGGTAMHAATLNDLYFGLDNMRGFAEVYWWFQADGRVFNGMPSSGLTQADFDSACKANPGVCGTYTLSGDKLNIKYMNAKTETWTYKPMNGGMQMNYLILTPVKKYPPGSKLNGTWSRASSSTMGGSYSKVTVTSPSWYTFKSDGTYSQKVIVGVDSQSKVKGANQSSSSTNDVNGTYSLNANILILNGQKHSVFPVAGDNLNIDGKVYTKQK
jgi:hypothetical protein